jgi:hypothetical protein
LSEKLFARNLAEEIFPKRRDGADIEFASLETAARISNPARNRRGFAKALWIVRLRITFKGRSFKNIDDLKTDCPAASLRSAPKSADGYARAESAGCDDEIPFLSLKNLNQSQPLAYFHSSRLPALG